MAIKDTGSCTAKIDAEISDYWYGKREFEKKLLVGNRTLEQAGNALVRADEAWEIVKSLLDKQAKEYEERVERVMDGVVKQKFPRGERRWCIECAQRIKKAVIKALKEK